MKCVCGYEHQTKWNQELEFGETVVGDKPFEEIRGNFTRIARDTYSRHIVDVTLYACPKCGTIRMDN